MTTAYASVSSELVALAGLNNAEDSYDRLRVEDGELVETEIRPTGTPEEKSVASEVKPDTPAAYLKGKTKKFIFCLDNDNVLQFYSQTIGADSWDEEAGSLGNDAITVPSNSKLAAGFSKDGVLVVFQDSDGKLNAVLGKDLGNWSVTGPLSSAANPVSGTPLQVQVVGPELRIYYINEDKYIHFLESSASGWNDHKVDYANLENDEARRFILVQVEEAVFYIYLYNVDDSMVEITPEKRTIVGKIKCDGQSHELELANKEECCYHGGPVFYIYGGNHTWNRY